MARTGRPPIPIEVKKLRGTFRPGRSPKPPVPLCGECGARATCEVVGPDGTVWGPWCDAHGDEASELLWGDQ